MSPPFDKDALRRKYAQERQKRLRPDGVDQYIRPTGALARFLADPWVPVAERPPVTDHATVVVVGAGFAGLLTAAHLKQAGVADVRILDKGGDVGGTWYWNRYPGAQCDTASLIYLPLLEETGYMPSEKYAHAPEILEHCHRIATHFGLYDGALFHTEVTDLAWQEADQRWLVRTNRGDALTAQFVVFGTGPLHVPKLPGIPGIDSFAGHAFHTSRWDYAYTGGDWGGAPMDRLADKRVAVIGTGATAIQVIPHLARACGELYVFQRTPSSVDVRNNEPIDAEWFATIATPGWQRRWLENFAANQTGAPAEHDLVMDGWTDIARRVRDRIVALPPEDRTLAKMAEAYEESDFEKMEQIRARIDALVADADTAEKLKPWYRQLCKRPCFHDEYLQAYNRPNTQLVDTDGKGVERITERGLVAGGQEYVVDCIVYASGFEVATEYTGRAGFDVTGRGGTRLSAYWADGMRTLHGLNVHGFPNAFLVQPTQGANLISNIPHNLDEAARTITAVISHAVENGYAEVEATAAAEAAWVELLLSRPASLFDGSDCTPGYYNLEGQELTQAARLVTGYPDGPSAFFAYIDQWRTAGFDGLEFRAPDPAVGPAR